MAWEENYSGMAEEHFSEMYRDNERYDPSSDDDDASGRSLRAKRLLHREEWLCGNGLVIKIADMDVNHLKNTISHLKTRRHLFDSEYIVLMLEELGRRVETNPVTPEPKQTLVKPNWVKIAEALVSLNVCRGRPTCSVCGGAFKHEKGCAITLAEGMLKTWRRSVGIKKTNGSHS